MKLEEFFKQHAPQTYQSWLVKQAEAVMMCPPCNGDCNQGRNCPGRVKNDNQSLHS